MAPRTSKTDAVTEESRLEEAVHAEVDRVAPVGIQLLADLVRVNSVNPNAPGVPLSDVAGGETRCNEILAEHFQQAGLSVEWVAPDERRKNLVGWRPGQGGGRSLILNGHVDTVPPVNPDGWRFKSPWSATIDEGRLYGLGATDMKAGLVAMWMTAHALEEAGVRLKGDLQLQSVVGEERMEHEIGTTACVDSRASADGAIVTEPSSFPSPLTVSPVSPGCLDLRIVIEGKATHCANRPLAIRPGGPGDAIGVNAVEKGVKIVGALQELEAQWVFSKSHAYFPAGFFTILPGIFHSDAGSPDVNYFADWAELKCVIWYPPDVAAQVIMQEVEQFIGAVADLDPWFRSHPPSFEWNGDWPPMATGWEHPLVQALEDGKSLVLGTAPTPPSPHHPVNFAAVADGTWLERAGIPSVVFGPGDIAVAHCQDEYVDLDEVVAAAKVLSSAAMTFCGVSGSAGSER